MSKLAVLGRNIVSNWAGFAFQIVITFILTPYIVGSLGSTNYGIWVLVTGLTGYYGLLDLGFSAGLTQYISRYLASREFDKLNETASTGFVVLAICAIVLLVVSCTLAFSLEWLFNLDAASVDEVRLAVLIVGGGVSFQFLFFPYSAVFPATQRFDIANAIGIGSRILFAIFTYVALERGYGLIGLSLAITVSSLLDYLVRWVVAHRLLPTLKVSRRLARMESWRELAHFGIWNVIVAGSVRLISYSDAVVIAVFLPPAAITPFALAASLTDYFSRVFVPIGHVFFPAFTELDTRGDVKGIRLMYINGSRLLAVLALPAGVVAYLFAADFFALWIGEPAAAGVYPSAAGIFSVLLVAAVFNSMQRISYQVLMGSRRLALLAKLFVAEALSNIVLSVILVQSMGLVGVAIGTLVPALIVEGILFPVVICRLYEIGIFTFVSRVYLRAIAAASILLPPLVWFRSVHPPVDWPTMVHGGIFAALIATAAIVTVGLTREERARFIWTRLEGGMSRFNQ